MRPRLLELFLLLWIKYHNGVRTKSLLSRLSSKFQVLIITEGQLNPKRGKTQRGKVEFGLKA